MNERGIPIPFQEINQAKVQALEQEKPWVKRVLYGAWDGTKKTLESQSPEAWGKRIMKVIDGKIVPRLTPEQQRWAEIHREGIKEAASYAGVGVTTAEVVLAVVAIDKGIQKLFPPRDFYPDLTQWAQEVGELFTMQHGVDAAAAGLFATTLRSMAIQALSDTPQLESAMHVALSKRKQIALDRVRHTFTRSYIDAAYQTRHPISRLDAKAQQVAAEQAFHQWDDGMQLRGLEEIFQLSQQRPHIDPQSAIKAAVRLSGRRLPITTDEKLLMQRYLAQTQAARDGEMVLPLTPDEGQKTVEEHEKNMKAIQRRMTQRIKIFGTASKWSVEPKPTTHRFLDADGHIIRPSEVPPQKKGKKAQETMTNAHQTTHVNHERMIQDREVAQRELGTFEHRLQRALQRAYPSREPQSDLLSTLLHRAHDRLLDRDEIGVLLVRIEHVGRFDHGDGVTLKDRKTIATTLFQKLFHELPSKEQKIIARKQREHVLSQLAERWTDQMNCAGLDVVFGLDIRDKLNEIAKNRKT